MRLQFDNTDADLGMSFSRYAVVSQLPWRERLFGRTAQYINRQIRSLDSKSIFASWAAKWCKPAIPAWLKIAALWRRGYDGMLFYVDGVPDPVARIFWQKHPSNGVGSAANRRIDLHVFSILVEPSLRGLGLAKLMGAILFLYAAQRKDVCGIRFGKGRGVNAAIIRHLGDLRSRNRLEGYDFVVNLEGWVIIIHDDPSSVGRSVNEGVLCRSRPKSSK